MMTGATQKKLMLEALPLMDIAPVWALETDNPILLRSARNFYPDLDSILEILNARFPVPLSCRNFKKPPYLRHIGHARSFCISTGKGELVFKGTEPLALDCGQMLRKIWNARPAVGNSKFDEFAVFEHEVFLAVTLKSAVSTAKVATTFSSTYLKQFNKLPKTPLPLYVWRLPDETRDEHLAKSQPYYGNLFQLSAWDTVNELANDGLAVFAYYYPGNSIRLAHFLGYYPGAETGLWTGAEPPPRFKPERTVRRWIELFSGIINCGYLPSAYSHAGNCLQQQNLTVEGGMCDLDSLHPLTRIRDTRELLNSLCFCLEKFSQSAAELMMACEKPIPADMMKIVLWQELSTHLIDTQVPDPLADILKLKGTELFSIIADQSRLN